MIGILGGMGSLATVDFFHKVLTASPTQTDAGHVPLLIQSDPRIPPRPAAILHGGTSPLDALLAGRDRLVAAGALALAMPCNTAHHWYPQLAADCPVPFLSIVEACCDELATRVPTGARIGVIATQATITAGVFDGPLASRGYTPVYPDAAAMQTQVLPAIEAVKLGRTVEGGRMIEQVTQQLLDGGVSLVILACTETPLALDAIESALRPQCLDSTMALARQCVRWWEQHLRQSGAAAPASA